MKKILAILVLCTIGTSVYSMTFPELKHIPPNRKPNSEGLLSYYQKLDPKALQIEDEGKLREYLLPFNYKINGYVQDRFKLSLTDVFERHYYQLYSHHEWLRIS